MAYFVMVSHLDCRPYISATLFRTEGVRRSLLSKLREAIESVLVNGGNEGGRQRGINRTIVKTFPTKAVSQWTGDRLVPL